MKAKRQVQQQLKRDYRRYKRRVAGILGDYSGTVDVPNRVGYVFVRLRNQEVKEAFNKRVPSLIDLPVWVGYSDDPGEPQILQVLDTRTGVERQKGEDPIGLYLPAHHETHEWFNPLGGQDVVFSDKRQFMPFRPTPIGGMLLHVYRNVGWLNGEYTFFSGSSIDLSPYVPATGAYFGLVYEDTNATLAFSTGTGDFLKNAFTLTLADIPNPTPGTYPIAAVRMWGGMTGIVEALDRTDLIDLRFPFTQNFLLLSDVPWSYTGSASQLVAVKSDETGLEFVSSAGITGSSPSTFLGLTDTPSSYSGQATRHVRVNAGATALEFVDAPVSGGGAGTLPIYDDNVFEVTGTALIFNSMLDVSVTGSFAYVDNGLDWISIKDYGAVGDGVTDDTSAIQNAAADIPSTGGVLYFPPGSYLTNGTNITLNYPTWVLGAGSASLLGSADATSKVISSSSTNSLFVVNSHSCRFQNIALENTAGTTPTAGAGIVILEGDIVRIIDVSINRFFINIDVQDGQSWAMRGLHLVGSVKYGIKIQHIGNVDGGDQSISDSVILADANSPDAGIRIESGGGLKLSNVKINAMTTASADEFLHGIDLQPAAGAQTSILLLSNVSIENIRGNGVNVVTTSGTNWDYMTFIGCQFGLYNNSTGNAINITCANVGEVDGVVILGCQFAGGTAAYAVSLTKVNNVVIGGNTLTNFGALYTQSGSTNIVVLGEGTDVATDAIWDAKGDLAAGTGADTAQRLAVGSNGQILSANGAQTTGLQWIAAPAGEVLMADGELTATPLSNDEDTDWLYE